MAMKKIAIFTSEFFPLRGGIGTYASEMARSAQELGADVTVFAPDYGQNNFDFDRLNFNFKVVRFPGARHSAIHLVRKILFVFGILIKERFDVVLAADWPFYLPVKISITTANKKYMVHGSELIEMCSPLKKAIVKAVGLFGRQGDFYTNSEFTKSLLYRIFGRKIRANVYTEILGTGKFWFGKNPETDYRKMFCIAESKYFLLTVARLTPRKGHLAIINALKKLPDHIKDNMVYGIVGPAYDAAYLNQINAEIKDCGCDVRLLGEISDGDLRGLYSVADTFCLVGQKIENGPVEGYGLVYMEAAAQGLPSIAGNIGGMPEAVIDNETGIVVDSSSTIEIKNAICQMYNSKDLRNNYSKAALNRAISLSWERCSKATFQL